MKYLGIIVAIAVLAGSVAFLLLPKEVYEVQGKVIELNTNVSWGNYVVIDVAISTPTGWGGHYATINLSAQQFSSLKIGQDLTSIRMRDIFGNEWNDLR